MTLMKIQEITLKSYQRDPRKLPDESFKYVDVSSVSRESYCITEYSTLKGKEAPSRARKIIESSDVIFATVRPTLMRIAIITEDFNNEICSTGYSVLKPNQKVINPQFLYYSVLTDSFISKIEKLQRGASYPAIRDSDLKAQIINIPPLPEQRKIAHVLSKVQKAIEQQDKLIRSTTELKKALMQKLFTEGTRGEPQKETEIGLVPESWEVKTVGEITDVFSGGTPSRTEKLYWENGTIPWVKTGEIDYCLITDSEEKITEMGYKKSSAKLCKKGTILMAMYGQGITRGKVAILGLDATINQACAAIVPKNENQIKTEFLYYFFEKNYEIIRNFGHGANQKNISVTLIKSIKVAFPISVQEQNKIVKILELLDKKIQINISKKQTFTDLFKTMLHELMTGQLRVHELEFEKMEEFQ